MQRSASLIRACNATVGCVLLLACEAGAGILSHWSFDEGSGQSAADSAGGNNGTLGSGGSAANDDPSWITDGAINGALNFDGSNDFVNVLSSESLDFSDCTISFWTKWSGSTTGLDGVISRGHSNESGSGTWAIRVNGDSSDRMQWRIYSSATFDSNETPSTDWENWTLTKSGSNYIWYRDGESIETATIDKDILHYDNLWIGRYDYSGNNGWRYFNGSIDDVGIWNNSLDAYQVRALHSLAVEPNLNYNLGGAQELFDMHADTGASSATVGGRQWFYATGLDTSNGPGNVVEANGEYYVPLEPGGTGVVAYAPTPLIAHWDFNEGSGSVAGDSARHNHGTLAGPAWSSDSPLGGALSFDGSDDRVNVTSNASLDFGDDATIAFWMKWSGVATGLDGVITRGARTDTATGAGTWAIRINHEAGQNDHMQLRIYGKETFDSGVTPSTEWECWALTKSGKDYVWYQNGQLVADATLTNNLLQEGNLQIGHYDSYVNGLLDDVGIWNEALAAPWINAMYTLADNAGLRYDQDDAARLFEVYDAVGATTVVINGWEWRYVTGLDTDLTLGEVTRVDGAYYLRLADGTGLTAVPEPSAGLLMVFGLAMGALFRRRRRATSGSGLNFTLYGRAES